MALANFEQHLKLVVQPVTALNKPLVHLCFPPLSSCSHYFSVELALALDCFSPLSNFGTQEHANQLVKVAQFPRILPRFAHAEPCDRGLRC